MNVDDGEPGCDDDEHGDSCDGCEVVTMFDVR